MDINGDIMLYLQSNLQVTARKFHLFRGRSPCIFGDPKCGPGGFLKWGNPPIAGWLISGKIPSFEMHDDWG